MLITNNKMFKQIIFSEYKQKLVRPKDSDCGRINKVCKNKHVTYAENKRTTDARKMDRTSFLCPILIVIMGVCDAID